ncbi:6de38831-60fc-4b14-ab26-4857639df2f9 [Sclerotinia trifoliorum]|uniref:6de38831-60fc-4b14-ab26-4857639df2f9 n=1 Tax=Sclerotinia trifoliorum TaxID=28548 RepID=A0A8H2VPQ4_9HELO|nr:6de38831-60fc-4b14-ab26-4857639df2f9 [Sclerotinia trifoliorum]
MAIADIKCLTNLPEDITTLIFAEILDIFGLWKALGLRVVCKLFKESITKAICHDYQTSSHGPVDDALERNPKQAVLAPIHQALQATRYRRSHSDEAETEFEIASSASSQTTIIERDFVDTSQLAEIQNTLSVAIIADDVAFIEDLFETWNLDADYDNQFLGGRCISQQRILLDNGADLNAIQPYYGPHWAPKFVLEKEKFICSSGCALRVAAFNGHLEFIKVLLQPCFNLALPLPDEELRNVIRAAARYGNFVQILVEDGASLLACDSSNTDPITIIAYAHHHHIVRFFLEEVAHHSETNDWVDKRCKQAFSYAIGTGDLEMVRLLVEAGCPITTKFSAT